MRMDSIIAFDAGGRDAARLDAESRELWTELLVDEHARAALKRDGLDPAQLRLSGPHPFAFAPAVDGARMAVTVPGLNGATANHLLDLFRLYFLRRLSA